MSDLRLLEAYIEGLEDRIDREELEVDNNPVRAALAFMALGSVQFPIDSVRMLAARRSDMSEKELRKQADGLKRLQRKVCLSKESALDFLVKAGICTKSGRLSKAYR